MKIFTSKFIKDLSSSATSSIRLRSHSNIHASYNDACQRLFNAIEPESYIRPHRHLSDPKEELLIAIRGKFCFIRFDDEGRIQETVNFGQTPHSNDLAIGVEISPSIWHTVLSCEIGGVLLEVKEGPFNPSTPKDLAPWAPEEGSIESKSYLNYLKHACF